MRGLSAVHTVTRVQDFTVWLLSSIIGRNQLEIPNVPASSLP